MTTELVGYDLRMPKKLLQQLAKEANDLNISINNHITIILENHVADYHYINVLKEGHAAKIADLHHTIAALQANAKYLHTT